MSQESLTTDQSESSGYLKWRKYEKICSRYRQFTVPELKDMIKAKAITGYSKKNKEDLIKMLAMKELWDQEEKDALAEKTKRFRNMSQSDIDDYMNVVEDEIAAERLEQKEFKRRTGLRRGKIYFMISRKNFTKRDGDRVSVKIGNTYSMRDRFRTHQTSHDDIQCPIAIIKTPIPGENDPHGKLHVGIEKRLHQTLNENGRHIRGEFYRLSRDEVRTLVERELEQDHRLESKHYYSG
jgi:hypothetical protein